MEVKSYRENSLKHKAESEPVSVFRKVASEKVLLQGLLFEAKSVEQREKFKFFPLKSSPFPKITCFSSACRRHEVGIV